LIQIGSKTAEKTLHKQTNRQTNRHYENNGHLAVNQLYRRQKSCSADKIEILASRQTLCI